MRKPFSPWPIPAREPVPDPALRLRQGMRGGALGIVLNLLLFAVKLIGGALSRSIAVTADAFNNLSDAASSLVTLAGFRIAAKKADREHPFGHGRFEYIAGLIVSMLILLMGAELIKSAVKRIATPVPPSFSWLCAGILVLSILVKCGMYVYNRRVGKRIDSPAMRAAALDSLADMAATGAVLLSTLIAEWTGLAIDGWAGLAVALFILYTGLRALKETIGPLLGQQPSADFIARIEAMVLAAPEVVGMHDLVVHNYGPGRVIVSLHAEVPAEGELLSLHEAVDELEKRLRDELGCVAVIHMDPVLSGDEHTDALKAAVTELVQEIDPRLSIHDFRCVPGVEHTKLVFDLSAPFGLGMSDEKLKTMVCERLSALDGAYRAVIDVDKSYDGE